MSDVPGAGDGNRSSNVDEEMLREVKPYIDALARKMASQVFSGDEIEDLAQNSWFKFWQISQVREIPYPRSYLWYIVRSEFVMMLRQRREYTSLLMYEEWSAELAHEDVLIESGEGMGDPAQEYEQKVALQTRMVAVVEAMSALPRRQRGSMACVLWEKLDNLIPYIDALRERPLDVEHCWPAEKVAKQRLQASCAPARQSMARSLGVNLSEYKPRSYTIGKRSICRSSCSSRSARGV